MPAYELAQDGPTAVLTLNRPPMNALDLDFLLELIEALERHGAEPPQGGLVLTGAGPAFSAGVDVKAIPAYTAEKKAETVRAINRMVTLLYGLPAATVGAVNGHALGGGFIMALACDIRVMSTAPAKYGLTEVVAGVPYPAAALEAVKAELSPPACRRLVLTGTVFGPGEAEAVGLADEMAEPDALVAGAVERVRALSSLEAFPTVKEQLKRDTLARMQALAADDNDPVIRFWTDDDH